MAKSNLGTVKLNCSCKLVWLDGIMKKKRSKVSLILLLFTLVVTIRMTKFYLHWYLLFTLPLLELLICCAHCR